MLIDSEEDKLLLIPGPTPVDREILTALATPTISHGSKRMAGIFAETLSILSRIMDNERGKTFVFSGSGTLAQEAAIVNFVEPSDRLLVASNGFFADRLAEIAQAHQLDVVTEAAEWGSAVTPERLREAIRQSKATVVAFTHVETSTGSMVPLPELLGVIQEAGASSIVDGVAAFAGIPEEMDAMGIDVLLTGAQKALGTPPGLAILGVRPAAWRRREEGRTPVKSFYLDLCRWLPVMEQADRYFSTHPVNLIVALHRALGIIEDEGLANRYKRHKRLGQNFRQGMLDVGFELFTDERYLAPTLSVLRTPAGISSSEFRRRLADNGVVAAGGIGDTEDRVVRFGHMGNIGDAEIAIALDATRRSLDRA